MANLDEYWSVVSQTVLVLGFALVTEVRRAARRWSYKDRVVRYLSAGFYLVIGAALVSLFNISLVALQSSEPRNDFTVWFVQATLPGIATLLIVNPIMTLASRGSADLYTVLYMRFPLARPARQRRRSKRMLRTLEDTMRTSFTLLRQSRSTRGVLRRMAAGQELTPEELDAAVAILRPTVHLPDESIQSVISLMTTGSIDGPSADARNEAKQDLLKILESSEAATEGATKALASSSKIRREVKGLLRELDSKKIPDEIEAQLQARFEKWQRSIAPE